MLLEISKTEKQFVKIEASKNDDLSELSLEKMIAGYRTDQSEEFILSENIFGEELFMLGNQVYTKNKKIADIIAIDKRGNGVIIELKKDKGKLGIETQALQYLVELSAFSGKEFIEKATKKNFTHKDRNIDQILEDIKNFVDDDVTLESYNQKSRIILLAQSFDSSIFSIGEWLDLQNISFRCIEYSCYKIKANDFIDFSIKFDRSKDTLYRIANNKRTFATVRKDTKIYWHNISTTQEQWNFLQEKGIIYCGFEGIEWDRGTVILKKYIKGDTVIAYASRNVGIIGYGMVEGNYRLVSKEEANPINGCRHWLDVKWKYTLPINHSIKRAEFEKTDKYPKIYHPVQTSSILGDQEQAKLLLEDIAEKAAKYGKVW